MLRVTKSGGLGGCGPARDIAANHESMAGRLLPERTRQ
jgi:hypothetical protein